MHGSPLSPRQRAANEVVHSERSHDGVTSVFGQEFSDVRTRTTAKGRKLWRLGSENRQVEQRASLCAAEREKISVFMKPASPSLCLLCKQALADELRPAHTQQM